MTPADTLPSAPSRSRHGILRTALALAAGAVLALPLAACSSGGHVHGAPDAQAGHADGASANGHAERGAGRPGGASEVDRTVAIELSDAMDYTPSSLQVARGETVRFAVRNGGRLVHEFVLGTNAELLAHRESMTSHPDMRHDEPGMLSLEPGGSGEVIWTFTEPGTFTYACLRPGHYEAGMRGEVVVAAAR